MSNTTNWSKAICKQEVQNFLIREGLAKRFPKNKRNAVLLMLRSGNSRYPIHGARTARILFHIHEKSITAEITSPFSCKDKEKLCRLLNELNLAEDFASYQGDTDEGQINYSYYVPCFDAFPEDEVMRTALKTCCDHLDRLVELVAAN